MEAAQGLDNQGGINENSSGEKQKPKVRQPGYNQVFKQLKFSDDLINGIQITQRKNAFKDFCNDFRHRVHNLTDDMQKKHKQQDSDKQEYRMLTEKYDELKQAFRAIQVDEKKQQQQQKSQRDLAAGLTQARRLEEKQQVIMAGLGEKLGKSFSSQACESVDTDQIEQEMWELQLKLESFSQRKETQAKKLTRIQLLKDDVDKVIYDNIQGLVDPNSKGAKMAQYEKQMDSTNSNDIGRLVQKAKEGAQKKGLPGKKKEEKLPQIKQDMNSSAHASFEALPNQDRSEPLQKIQLNYKEQDVTHIHFKKLHAISPTKFTSEIEQAAEESAYDKDREINKHVLRNKIHESNDNVKRIKSGVELHGIVKSFNQILKKQLQTQASNFSIGLDPIEEMSSIKSFVELNAESAKPKPKQKPNALSSGLPIFDSTYYKRNLQKLLSSKDLDECYDYENNDQSYTSLYQCLNHNRKKENATTSNLNNTLCSNALRNSLPEFGRDDTNDAVNPIRLNASIDVEKISHLRLTGGLPEHQMLNEESRASGLCTPKNEDSHQHATHQMTAWNTDSQDSQMPGNSLNSASAATLKPNRANRIIKQQIITNDPSQDVISGWDDFQRQRYETTNKESNQKIQKKSNNHNVSLRDIIRMNVYKRGHKGQYEQNKTNQIMLNNAIVGSKGFQTCQTYRNSIKQLQLGQISSIHRLNVLSDRDLRNQQLNFNQTSMRSSVYFPQETTNSNSYFNNDQRNLNQSTQPDTNLSQEFIRHSTKDKKLTTLQSTMRNTQRHLNQSMNMTSGIKAFKLDNKHNRIMKSQDFDESETSKQSEYENSLKQQSYDSLNDKLMYPNNPAYFYIKELSSVEDKAKKFLQSQGKKTQSLLEYCREQGIAFTETDKVMQNLQKSKKLHYLLKQFIDKNIEFVKEEEFVDERKNQSTDVQALVDGVSIVSRRTHTKQPNKYQGSFIAFDKDGEFNRNLDSKEMIDAFDQIIQNNYKIPEQKLKSFEKQDAIRGKLILPPVKGGEKRETQNVSVSQKSIEIEKPAETPRSPSPKRQGGVDSTLIKNRELQTNTNRSGQNQLKLKTQRQQTKRSDKTENLSQASVTHRDISKLGDLMNDGDTIQEELPDKDRSESETSSEYMSPQEVAKLRNEQYKREGSLRFFKQKAQLMQKRTKQRLENQKYNTMTSSPVTSSPDLISKIKKQKCHVIKRGHRIMNTMKDLLIAQTSESPNQQTLSPFACEHGHLHQSKRNLQDKLSYAGHKSSARDKKGINITQSFVSLYEQNMKKTKEQIQKDLVNDVYRKRNRTFKRGLQKLEDSINEPADREQYIKEVESLEYQEKKQQRLTDKTKSQDSRGSSNSNETVSDTKSQKQMQEERIKDCDPSYGMLDVCLNAYQHKKLMEEKSARIIQRLELDLPILQREKFEVLYLEKGVNESKGASEEQKQFTKQLNKFITKNYNSHTSAFNQTGFSRTTAARSPAGPTEAGATQTPSIAGLSTSNLKRFRTTISTTIPASPNTKNHKYNVTYAQIKNTVHKRKQQRKVDNEIQLDAYRKMCHYIRDRFNESNRDIRPTKIELKMLEVLKKIVESGWIITILEIKQIMAFLDIKLHMVQGVDNQKFKKFLELVMAYFDVQGDVEDIITEAEEDRGKASS